MIIYLKSSLFRLPCDFCLPIGLCLIHHSSRRILLRWLFIVLGIVKHLAPFNDMKLLIMGLWLPANGSSSHFHLWLLHSASLLSALLTATALCTQVIMPSFLKCPSFVLSQNIFKKKIERHLWNLSVCVSIQAHNRQNYIACFYSLKVKT